MLQQLSALSVRFMIKPYRLTGEARYVGLPLGFSFLGISYILSTLTVSQPYYSLAIFSWLQLLIRTFAFAFLATTYYFSKKPSKNTRLLWDTTLSLLIVALITAFLLLANTSESTLEKLPLCPSVCQNLQRILPCLRCSPHT